MSGVIERQTHPGPEISDTTWAPGRRQARLVGSPRPGATRPRSAVVRKTHNAGVGLPWSRQGQVIRLWWRSEPAVGTERSSRSQSFMPETADARFVAIGRLSTKVTSGASRQ